MVLIYKQTGGLAHGLFDGATEHARHEFAAPTCKGGKCET